MEQDLAPHELVDVTPWFEREFQFSIPVDQYPNICIRLQGTPARLEEITQAASREALLHRPSDDKWSAQEHSGHLLDMEPLWLMRVNDFLTPAETLTVADLTNRKTYEAVHNARQLTEILTAFRTARVDLLKRLETLGPSRFAETALHPRLKQHMRLIDHLHFVAEHDDHHLATIWQLIHRSNQSHS